MSYNSPNAPTKADVLGTWLLSILSGHKRYSHVTAIRCDGVNPGLLGMRKVISEDALRRALAATPEAEGVAWLDRHLEHSDAHAARHSLPGLLKILDALPPARRPQMIRGDCGFGSEPFNAPLEERGQPYLFKLRLSKNVKRHIERIFWDEGWRDATALRGPVRGAYTFASRSGT